MRLAYSYYRAYSIVERGGSRDDVIKECILAFPSLWVVAILCPDLPLLLKGHYQPAFGQSVPVDFPPQSQILILHSHHTRAFILWFYTPSTLGSL
jgi:hypothetical protein